MTSTDVNNPQPPSDNVVPLWEEKDKQEQQTIRIEEAFDPTDSDLDKFS
jgi:hypothetical protein